MVVNQVGKHLVRWDTAYGVVSHRESLPGALALRLVDLDPQQYQIFLREKGGSVRWQPISPTLTAHLQVHARERNAPRDSCCDIAAGGRSRTAGTTTCGSGSASTYRGSPRNRSVPTGCGTPP